MDKVYLAKWIWYIWTNDLDYIFDDMLCVQGHVWFYAAMMTSQF